MTHTLRIVGAGGLAPVRASVDATCRSISGLHYLRAWRLDDGSVQLQVDAGADDGALIALLQQLVTDFPGARISEVP